MHPGLDLGWSCRAAAWLLPSAIGIPMAMRSVLSVHCMYVRTIGRPSHAHTCGAAFGMFRYLCRFDYIACMLRREATRAQYRCTVTIDSRANMQRLTSPQPQTHESAHRHRPRRTTVHRSRNNHVPQLPRRHRSTAPHSSPDATAMTTTPRTSPTRQQHIMPTQRNLHLP